MRFKIRTCDVLDPRPFRSHKTVPIRDDGNALWFDQLDNLSQAPEESGLGRAHLLRAAVNRERRDARLNKLRDELERWGLFRKKPNFDVDRDSGLLYESLENLYRRSRVSSRLHLFSQQASAPSTACRAPLAGQPPFHPRSRTASDSHS